MSYPIFTRYLYDYFQVIDSLECALIEKQREEALFWAYEVYHSGFQQAIWDWINEIYVQCYEQNNPRFKAHLDGFYKAWKENENDHCLLGTVVGTMAMLDCVGEVTDGESKGKMKFIILYKEDRHQTKPVTNKPRNYLRQVSQYPIRLDSYYEDEMQTMREAYLGPNWLYWCADTPIWISRIQEYRGKKSETGKEEIVFESDEDLEAFYEKWGFEPDEQSEEMHAFHGVYLEREVDL